MMAIPIAIAILTVVTVCLSPRLAFATPAAEQSQAAQKFGEISKIYLSGDFLEAARLFEEGCQKELEPKTRLSYCNALGGAKLSTFQYRGALAAFLKARDLANEVGDTKKLGIILSNIAALYSSLYELEAAGQAANEAIKRLPPESPYLPAILLQVSDVAMRRDQLEEARSHALKAVELASSHTGIPSTGKDPRENPGKASTVKLSAAQRAPWELLSKGWDKLGTILYAQRNLSGAEAAFLEAFRIRKIFETGNLTISYLHLAWIADSKGDQTQRLQLLDRAIRAMSETSNQQAEWQVYYARGQAREARQDFQGALADYRTAWEMVDNWRSEALTSQWILSATDILAADVSFALADLLSRHPELRGRQAASTEAWATTERSRAASLRTMLVNSAQLFSRLSPEYEQVLAQLRLALQRGIAQNGRLETQQISSLRARLSMMESEAGAGLAATARLSQDTPAELIGAVRSVLGPDEALLTYHVGAKRSWLWCVTREYLGQFELPGKAALEKAVTEFETSIRNDAPQQNASAVASMLLPGLPRQVLQKTRWLLSLDDVLYKLPWPALPGQAGKKYLIEERTLEALPSAVFLLARKSRNSAKPGPSRMVAIGDPVYNRADSRLPASLREEQEARKTDTVNADNDFSLWALPRLAGSAREVQALKSIWDSNSREVKLLTGMDVNRENLRTVLATNPEVLHFAVHVLPAPEVAGPILFRLGEENKESALAFLSRRPDEMFVALSLGERGMPEMLSTAEISVLRANNPLIVLNGCGSGQGAVLPGTGLQGLTRSWMTAGARGVLVSRWPMPDDTGPMFEAFYQALLSNRKGNRITASEALQTAQLAMLQSGKWRAKPKFWASYFLMGRE